MFFFFFSNFRWSRNILLLHSLVGTLNMGRLWLCESLEEICKPPLQLHPEGQLLHKVATTVSLSFFIFFFRKVQKLSNAPVQRHTDTSQSAFCQSEVEWFLLPMIYMQCIVLLSLEEHFEASFTRELWTMPEKSLQCNVLNKLVPTCSQCQEMVRMWCVHTCQKQSLWVWRAVQAATLQGWTTRHVSAIS